MKYTVKESIKNFKRYRPNSQSYRVKLDANESSRNLSLLKNEIDFSRLNLYPDNQSLELRNKIAAFYQIANEEVMVGAGSSELLELVIKTFLNPKEVVLSVEPSFVMYEKYTMLAGGSYKAVPVSNGNQTNVEVIIKGMQEYKPKIVFLCSPNNPTGFMLTKEQVIEVIESTESLVVVDEAYMEYAESNESVIDEINQYPNLIVNRTFSKAYGLAGARLGYFIANKELIATLAIAKTPYSVNTVSQALGCVALDNPTYLKNTVETNNKERLRMRDVFNELGIVNYPSNGNFIYTEFNQYDLATYLSQKGVLVRSFNNGFYRITIGTPTENDVLIEALKEVLYENSNNI